MLGEVRPHRNICLHRQNPASDPATAVSLAQAASIALPAAMRPDVTTSLLTDLRWLRKLAGTLTRDSHLAEDAVQEACAQALSQPEPPMAPRAWLATVLRNWLARHRRSERARRERETTTAAGQGPRDRDSVTLLERAEIQNRLATAVLRLCLGHLHGIDQGGLGVHHAHAPATAPKAPPTALRSSRPSPAPARCCRPRLTP